MDRGANGNVPKRPQRIVEMTRYAVLGVAILASAAGCATLNNASTRSTEQMLAKAGFHARAADTAELQSLPARQLLSRSQSGVVSYVFSDPVGCHCVYVGSEREYQEYQRLRREEDASMNCWGWPWCNGYGG
jgi:hypothetical protein